MKNSLCIEGYKNLELHVCLSDMICKQANHPQKGQKEAEQRKQNMYATRD